MSAAFENAVLLQHPCGTRVLLLGTSHVSARHGSYVSEAIERCQPRSVVLEIDEERYQQLDFRLAHLLQCNTAELMALTAGPADSGSGDEDDGVIDQPGSNNGSSSSSSNRTSGKKDKLLYRLLPDTLWWMQHREQFNLMRNEGVPLLLGSLYGADFLQAGLTATLALPQPAAVLLADQQQQLTMARFRRLADGLGQLQQLLVSAIAGVAHAEPLQQHAEQRLPGQQKQGTNYDSGSMAAGIGHLAPVLAAAGQLATERIFHLFLQWWSMMLSTQAQWYGQQVHPVFFLADSVSGQHVQQQLLQRGCIGVCEAAAAAKRLLLWAAEAGGSKGQQKEEPLLWGDIEAIRKCVYSMEQLSWQQDSSRSEISSSSSSSESNSESSSSSSSSSPATPSSDLQEEQQPLLLVRPWWQSLSERFNKALGSAAVTSFSAFAEQLQQGHKHMNMAAAMAYERAVMTERNALLTAALWEQAAAVTAQQCGSSNDHCSSKSGAHRLAAGSNKSLLAAVHSLDDVQEQEQEQEQEQAPAVVGVVGVNHVSGILQEWELRKQQWQQQQQQQWQQQQQQMLMMAEPQWRGVDQLQASSSSSSSSHALATANVGSSNGQLPTLSHMQVVAVDAAASVLELLAAGGAGLAYLKLISRYTQPAAAAGQGSSSSAAASVPFPASRWSAAFAGSTPAAAGGTTRTRYPQHSVHGSRNSSSSGGGMSSRLLQFACSHQAKRLALLLLPVGIALLPLQREVGRMQEASDLLMRVSTANDKMMSHGKFGSSASDMVQLVQQQHLAMVQVHGVTSKE